MENLKIQVNGEGESIEAQELFIQLGYKRAQAWNKRTVEFEPNQIFAKGGILTWMHNDRILFEKHENKEITLQELRDKVILHRNDPEDATHTYNLTSGECMGCVLIGEWWHWFTGGQWGVFTHKDSEQATCIDPIQKQQPEAKETLNEIVRTTEVRCEHNLSNELNDLCAEFGCPPGADRMRWLRDRLRGGLRKYTLPEFGRICAKQNVSSKFIGLRSAIEAKRVAEQIYPISQNVTVYHYSASVNTSRGTITYDGVITFPGRITGIEDYRKVRAEIATDGNVAPEQVNVHSLTVIN